MINALIHTAVRILIGWLLIERVPAWLNIRGIVATYNSDCYDSVLQLHHERCHLSEGGA